MKKYVFKRILASIFSLLVVVAVVMLLVYSAIERNVIFQQDDIWNKRSNNDQKMYEYAQYQKFGYLSYIDYGSFLKQKYLEEYGEGYDSQESFATDRKIIQKPKEYLENASVQDFIKTYEAKGYEIKYLEPVVSKSGKVKKGGDAQLLAIQEKSVFYRLWDYFSHFITVETTKDVEDPNLTDRYVRFEKDPYSGLFALVGSGTTHKYLLYFDSSFPFIHQNWMHLNLGTSYTTYRGQEITEVITTPAGKMRAFPQQFPNQLGTGEYTNTAVDFHSRTYNSAATVAEIAQFGDAYTAYSMHKDGLSPIGVSFLIGILATVLAYLLGLPAGILAALFKDRLVDKIGNAYIIFVMACPSLAYIFIVAALGTQIFGLPYKFATAQSLGIAIILPVISMALRQIGSLMKWVRRYMIDEMNADYVKFARAEGMSEGEIYRTHISRNAMIRIVHDLPAEIIFCLTGAIITERVYGIPGVGQLLTTALTKHDNGVIVAAVVFYTSLSLLALLLGDLLLIKYDPRISLTSEGGGGR